jgi:cell division septation protein DedD
MPDQEVHEIQLNGKQLVFMFMAATAVAVVIFFCGVMVGRGVRQPQAAALAAGADPSIDPTASLDVAGGTSALPVEPTPDKENLTYAERLVAPLPLNEPLKFTEAKPPPAKVETPVSLKAETPAPAKAAKTPQPKERPRPTPAPQSQQARKTDAVPASTASLSGKGAVYQLQVFPTRAEADAQRDRLKAKGYPVFVEVNPKNAQLKYRLRVGPYTNQRDADAALLRLKREEHFEAPWRIP